MAAKYTDDNCARSSDGRFGCDRCDLTFATAKAAGKHARACKDIHYDCDYCDAAFKTPYEAGEHSLVCRNNVKPEITCPRCLWKFRFLDEYYEHAYTVHRVILSEPSSPAPTPEPTDGEQEQQQSK